MKRIPVSITLEKELVHKLKEIAEKKGLYLSQLINMILKENIHKYE